MREAESGNQLIVVNSSSGEPDTTVRHVPEGVRSLFTVSSEWRITAPERYPLPTCSFGQVTG